MDTNSTIYRNPMVLSAPVAINHPSHQLPFFNGLYRTSYYPIPQDYSYEEHILNNSFYSKNRLCLRRQSTDSSPSSSIIPTNKMQQTTVNDSAIGVPSPLCSVCGDISTGIHFGGNSCESCKAFFRRSVQCLRYQNYKCSGDERCPVNIVTRKVCQFCRYTKCTAIGMKPKWVLSDEEREEKYGARRKRFRQNRVTDEDPDIFKYLTKEEKVLIEDIAHALYQSRATYPLTFPNPESFKTAMQNLGAESKDVQSPASEKPPNPAANFLIVPIQRLVLFARMLKDFDLFSEDDKVALLKGSAMEITVSSANTLFNPKTHTFTNYLSRDQQAVVDNQVFSLDPILFRIWGEDIFNRTKTFLISMCSLNIDEITSTLLVPVMLFSPDRLNLKDIILAKRLQEKYVLLLKKYMNWRYGHEQTETVYPKLLLQMVNLRALSLSHAEVIQRFMSSSSVNPLVQEIIIRPEMFKNSADSSSYSSSPPDTDLMDFDKTPSNDAESFLGSDEDDYSKKKQHSSMDDDLEFDLDDFDESNPRNIWRKRRKYSDSHPPSSTVQPEPNLHAKHLPNSQLSSPPIRPYDHQVPSTMLNQHDDVTHLSNGFSPRNQFGQNPTGNQSFGSNSHPVQQLHELDRAHSSSSTTTTGDLPKYDLLSRENSVSNAIMSPSAGQFYDDPNDPQQYVHPASSNYQQQQNEQQLHHLSLGNNPNPISPTQLLNNPQSQLLDHFSEGTTLKDDEQQLLNAIHAHPNKRDLVLSLLRQMDQSNSSLHPQYSDPSTN